MYSLRTFRTVQPFICPRCQLRSRKPQRNFSSGKSNSQKYLRLPTRTLIRLAGPDAANFLHNIIPAKILDVGSNPVYTAFLSAQGRILNDVFIYPPPTDGPNPDQWLIEVDEASAAELMKHLKKHKLRSKFKLERLDPETFGVYYSWPELYQEAAVDQKETKAASTVGGQDPRPGMGMRWVAENNNEPKSEWLENLMNSSDNATPDEYTMHRMLNGIAEGQSEIISAHALPQESNLDFFGGIDFQKGCYLGQELTIRTHHTGVVRKRILPCQIYEASDSIPDTQPSPKYQADANLPQPAPESNLSKLSTKKGRSTGKWLGGIGNIGLALCRLEMMTDIQLTADRTNFNPAEEYRVQWEPDEKGTLTKEVKIKPFVPAWLRDGVEHNLRRKDRKPKKRDEDDDGDVD